MRGLRPATLVPKGLAGSWRRVSPPRLLASSFGVLILLGTLALRLLPGLYEGPAMSWTDALFTATSAVCVTGLVVSDTGATFTLAGEGVLLVLIQLGGLGMITFASLTIVALGGRLSLRQESLSNWNPSILPRTEPERLVRHVVAFTIAIELAGAFLLWALWAPAFGPRQAVWPALFHSVSAFCNAGFSTFADSLIGFQRDGPTLLVLMLLIVAGGLGFLTIEEVARRARGGRRFRLSLHSRLVLASTAVLIVAGAVAAGLFEWRGALAPLDAFSRVTNAMFISITARTAGFNTIDYAAASESTNFLTILLMTVGGSPGSTAGGLKTTTVALILLLAWARLRGRRRVDAWSRSVPEEIVQRATGLFVLSALVMTAGVFVLTASEYEAAGPADDFLARLFEVVSAFNTVGLSLGVTAGLSTVGKITLILLMYVGRIGPLSVAAALARPPQRGLAEVRYAHEEVVIG